MAVGQKKSWTPPDDMPPEQAEACLAGKMCGARIKNFTTHKYCRQAPAPGQVGGYPHRCRRHGGCGGPPPGTRNALKHGIYSDALMSGEEEIYDTILVGDLTHEIKITKLRLRRALKAERQQHIHLASTDPAEQQKALVLEATDTDTERLGHGTSKIVKTKVTRRATDFSAIINSLVNQLVKLEGQRALAQTGNGLGAEEQARIARETLEVLKADLE